MKNIKKLEETIQRVATNTNGYTKKQANKEWFDEECAKVNEKKKKKFLKSLKSREKERRQRASHPNQNQKSQECLQTSPNKR
jgi:hypothetical protein